MLSGHLTPVKLLLCHLILLMFLLLTEGSLSCECDCLLPPFNSKNSSSSNLGNSHRMCRRETVSDERKREGCASCLSVWLLSLPTSCSFFSLLPVLPFILASFYRIRKKTSSFPFSSLQCVLVMVIRSSYSVRHLRCTSSPFT